MRDAKDLKNLKYLVITESSYDPPSGAVTVHHDCWSEDMEELVALADDVIEIMRDIADEDSEEDAEAIEELMEARNVSPDFVSDIDVDVNSINFCTEVYAEGEEIADAALGFYEDNLSEWVYDVYGSYVDEDYFKTGVNAGDEAGACACDNSEDKECEEACRYNEIDSIVNNVSADDYDSVLKLLKMISEEIEVRNNSMW